MSVELTRDETCEWCRQDGCTPATERSCPCPHHKPVETPHPYIEAQKDRAPRPSRGRPVSVERVDTVRDEAIRDVAEALAARWSRERLTNDSDPEYDAEAAVDCLLAAGWRPADAQVEAERDALRARDVEAVRWLEAAEVAVRTLWPLTPMQSHRLAGQHEDVADFIEQACGTTARRYPTLPLPPAADSGTPPAKEDA